MLTKKNINFATVHASIITGLAIRVTLDLQQVLNKASEERNV